MKPTYDQLVDQMRSLVDAAVNMGGNPAGWLARETRLCQMLLQQIAEVKGETPALPTVIVEINGGVLNLARSSVPLRLVVLDQDVEGGDESNIIPVDGEMVYVTDMRLEVGCDPGQGGVSPDVVQKILQQIDDEFEHVRSPVAHRA